MESVTAETFEAEVVNSETPVLVDFWAEWCGPCHAVAPVLERIAEERVGELKIVKLNIDEEQDLAMRYGVMSIPTMILFRDGEPAAAVSGAHPEGRDRARSRPRAGRGVATRARPSGVRHDRYACLLFGFGPRSHFDSPRLK